MYKPYIPAFVHKETAAAHSNSAFNSYKTLSEYVKHERKCVFASFTLRHSSTLITVLFSCFIRHFLQK